MNPYQAPATLPESQKRSFSHRLQRACAATAYGAWVFIFLGFAITVLTAGKPSRNAEIAMSVCYYLGMTFAVTACVWMIGHWLVSGIIQLMKKNRA